MCLFEVLAKIDSGNYDNLADYAADLMLILSNAKIFNVAGSQVYMDAEDLEAEATRVLGRPLQHLANESTKTAERAAAAAENAKKKRKRGVESLAPDNNASGNFWRVLEEGLKIDVMDTTGHWYSGKVVEIDDLDGKAKVHFDGYVARGGGGGEGRRAENGGGRIEGGGEMRNEK